MLDLLVVCSSAMDVLVAWTVLRRLAGETTEAKALRWAVIAAGVALVLKIPLHGIGGLNAWGVMRMAYVWCVVVLPAIGLVAYLGAWRGWLPTLSRGTKLLAGLLVACSLVGVQASWIEPTWLVVERATVELPPARSGSDPIRVGVLADIQTDAVGEHEHRAVDLLLAERPDVILLPGDLFHARWKDHPGQWEAFRELLMRMEAPGGAFVVVGDVDTPHELRRLTEGTPVTPLLDEAVRLTIGDRKVELLGVTSTRFSRRLNPWIDAFQREPGDDAVRIVFAHHPDVSLHLGDVGRLDLVVAGHTHGGQVVVPFFGPPFTISNVPREVAAGGLHELGGSPLYVSRGVGLERNQAPRIRLFCRPEVSLIELR